MNNKNPNQESLVIYDPPAALPRHEHADVRLLRDGPAALSVAELLEVVIGGAKAECVARLLLNRSLDLRAIMNMSAHELARSVPGLSRSKAIKLKACLELGKRVATMQVDVRPQIKSPADAARLLQTQMGLLEQEEVHVALLDVRNRLITAQMIYRGSQNSSAIRPCELFKEAIRVNAAAIIMLHNHPSTDPSPSHDDIACTREVIKAGKLLGIEVLDHLILGGNKWVSLKERGLAFGERP